MSDDVENPPVTCVACRDVVPEGDEITENDDTYCPDCHSERFCSCDSCGETVTQDDITTCSGDALCETCHDESYFHCGRCGECSSRNDYTEAPDGQAYCSSCADRHLRWCDRCDAYAWAGSRCCEDENVRVADTTFERNKSRRTCGFELEYIGEDCVSSTLGVTKEDGSLSDGGLEFASHVFAGDRLLDAIARVCRTLNENGATIDSSCGFHLHLGVRDLNDTQRENVYQWFYAFQPFIFAMMTPSRRNNSFCKPCPPDMDTDGDRYCALNVTAAEKHGTFEIRLHSGTTNAAKVANWAMLFLAFFDTLANVDASDERLAAVNAMSDRGRLIFLFQQLALPLSLRKYIVRRIRQNNHTNNLPVIDRFLNLSPPPTRQLGLALEGGTPCAA